MKLIVHTDGGSRGNPGQAAIGVVIEEAISRPSFAQGFGRAQQSSAGSRKLIAEIGKTIGETTNNVAEYTAVQEALMYLNNYPIIQLSNYPIIQFYLDSLLVVQQLNGIFKIKDAKLRDIFFSIKSLETEIGGVISYDHIPREKNERADVLVNRALDEKH